MSRRTTCLICGMNLECCPARGVSMGKDLLCLHCWSWATAYVTALAGPYLCCHPAGVQKRVDDLLFARSTG